MLKMNQQEKKEVRTYYYQVRRSIAASPIEALRIAIIKLRLLQSLKDGFSYFTYKKANGEIRETIATLDAEIKPDYKFKGGKAQNDMVVTAWDTKAANWRSFRVDRVVTVHI